MNDAEKLDRYRKMLADGLIDEEEFRLLTARLTVTASGDRAVATGGDVRDSATITGDRNVTAAGGSVAVGGNVGGDVVMPGGAKVIHPDPAAAARTHLRQTYLERFAHRCNVLPLAALGADREAEEALTLDAIYVDLDTKTRIPLTGEEKKKREKEMPWRVEDDRPLSAQEAARRETRLALLGDPGSGKTTFVRQLAGRLARACLNPEEPLPGWDAPLFPLLTSLRRLAPPLAGLSLDRLSAEEQSRQLVEAVCARWQADLADLRVEVTPAELERLLSGERLLVIFDGLDEVPDALRPWVNRAVQAVLHTYPNIERVIVTCRVRSYSGGAELSGFARHELAPFDEDKIRQFVAAWYGAQVDRLGQSEAEQRAKDLGRAVLDRDLFSLAQNPMLLTTMAIIHQQDARLPRERVRLYRRAVEILLQKWQKQKGLAVSDRLAGVLSDEMKMRAVLQLLAYRLHEQQARGGGDELPRQEIVAWLEGPAYLGDLALAGEFLEYVDQRAGLLVGRGGVAGEKPRVYDFPHRTFQEYLAGCYMASGRLAEVKREYRRRSEEGDFWQVAAQLGAEELLYNRDSPETLLDLAYSLCPVSEPPAEAGAWRRVLWSGRMAEVLGRQRIESDDADEDNGPRYLVRLLERLVQLVRSDILPAQERALAGDVLAWLGDPRPEVMTVEGMQFCLVPAGPFLMGSNKSEDEMAYDEEEPRHEVDIPYDYLIGRYPVTVAQWRAFVDATGHEPKDPDSLHDPANRPVRWVTWYEAVAFCQWLEERFKVSGSKFKVWRGDGEEVLDLSGQKWCIRLPSEAEWEKAARGPLTPSPPAATPGETTRTRSGRIMKIRGLGGRVRWAVSRAEPVRTGWRS